MRRATAVRRLAAACLLAATACGGGGKAASTTSGSGTPSTAAAAVSTTAPPTGFQRFKSGDAIAAFRKAGLEVGTDRPMIPKDYGLAPLVAKEGTYFVIPSLVKNPGEEAGGRVMSFGTQADLDTTKAYYDNLAKASAAFFSWTFVNGNELVQINGDLPEPKARQYEAALKTLR